MTKQINWVHELNRWATNQRAEHKERSRKAYIRFNMRHYIIELGDGAPSTTHAAPVAAEQPRENFSLQSMEYPRTPEHACARTNMGYVVITYTSTSFHKTDDGRTLRRVDVKSQTVANRD